MALTDTALNENNLISSTYEKRVEGELDAVVLVYLHEVAPSVSRSAAKHGSSVKPEGAISE